MTIKNTLKSRKELLASSKRNRQSIKYKFKKEEEQLKSFIRYNQNKLDDLKLFMDLGLPVELCM